MAKQRMIAGYNLDQRGIQVPGEPVLAGVKVPSNATLLCVRIDGRGNFVLFAEVWSHPEGTKINFTEHEFLIIVPNKPIPQGSWEYWQTTQMGPLVFHILTKGSPKLISA